MKLKLLITSLLFCFIASAQITDPAVLRNYINSTVIPNNTRNVTAQQLNNIMNGTLNVMNLADIDSFSTSKTFDTLYVFQHNSNGVVVKKGYHIGGNFDTTSLNNRINLLNNSKLNSSDSLTKYVTPSQLQQVSGGNVYHPGDDIIQISGSAISVDTITGIPTKAFLSGNYAPKTRKINNKSLSSDVTLTKADFNDLNVVDNTSDMDKPVSNNQKDSLNRKVDKSTTINGKSLSGNININQEDIGLPHVDDTRDVDKPVSTATASAINQAVSVKADTSDLHKKVDKITGKGLSTKDYTVIDSSRVATIPTLASKDTTTALRNDLNSKVDKRTGYDLSSNDYTATDKTTVALVPGKEDKFTKVPFSTAIKLIGRRMSDPYIQTGKLIFSIDSFLIGGQYKQTIISNGDSLVFDTSLFVIEKDYYPQANRINDIDYQKWADGKVHVSISTRNRNIPNLQYSDDLQVTFMTPAGYLWSYWTVNNNTSDYVTVFAGTALGLSDIVPARLIPPGESMIEPMVRFDTSTIIFLTIPTAAKWTVNDTNYNK